MAVIIVEDDSQFQTQLTEAGNKLVVVDFTASWCGPCQRIAPVFEQLSTRYPAAVFLKVDVDKCQQTAMDNSVRAMPTFHFFRNRVKVDSMTGADPNSLETKIKQWIGSSAEGADDDVNSSLVPGHVDLNLQINSSESECLNESDDNPFSNSLSKGGNYLESDCDEQILLHVSFTNAVKVHSLRLNGQADRLDQAPRTVKIFINQPHPMDFDKAESREPIQLLELTRDDVKEDAVIPLKYVKFQNVQNITLFIKDNQGEEDTTVIQYIGFIGSPLQTTKMSEFKRVAGKKGESH